MIEISAAKGQKLILTILSVSAQSALVKLKQQLEKREKVEFIYVGHSPWEGEWRRAIQDWKPSLFVTAKYEAWPDLWISLQEERVPLVIVSARARKSLRFAKWFCEFLGSGLPHMILFPGISEDFRPLSQLFPGAMIETVGEPRWDRVYSRLKAGNARAKVLLETFQDCPRPWGVIGSAWLKDLQFLQSFLSKFTGTLWIVPHCVDSQSIDPMQKLLSSIGIEWSQTSTRALPDHSVSFDSAAPGRRCILVDEMGVLTELYSAADWVFVGGGFGVGVHSTVEPAFYGMPIGTGPNGIEKFSEIGQLVASGQLKILNNESDLELWSHSLIQDSSESRKRWIQDAHSRLGASKKIWSILEKRREK
jgi:3-deoxy-D-manno-octulosonic-acid transferase